MADNSVSVAVATTPTQLPFNGSPITVINLSGSNLTVSTDSIGSNPLSILNGNSTTMPAGPIYHATALAPGTITVMEGVHIYANSAVTLGGGPSPSTISSAQYSLAPIAPMNPYTTLGGILCKSILLYESELIVESPNADGNVQLIAGYRNTLGLGPVITVPLQTCVYGNITGDISRSYVNFYPFGITIAPSDIIGDTLFLAIRNSGTATVSVGANVYFTSTT